MRYLKVENIEVVKQCHFSAVVDRLKTFSKNEVKDLFDKVSLLLPSSKSFDEYYNNNDYSWLEGFILADINKMRQWKEHEPEHLSFITFRDLYNNYFSKSSNVYLDIANTYNAYEFLKLMSLRVCPYCDSEYISEFTRNDGSNRRISEIDHFFSKSDYPALAMCFYNLIPSGMGCNHLKNRSDISASPYDENIESLTHILHDLPMGINFQKVSTDDFGLKLNAKGNMVSNDNVLALEIRYQNYKDEALLWLQRKQIYTSEKISEMIKIGIFPDEQTALESLFGPLSDDKRKNMLHQKMKYDLIGM